MIVGGVWLAVTLASLAVIMRLPRTYGADANILIESAKVSGKVAGNMVDEQIQDRLEQLKQRITSYNKVMQLFEKFGMYESDRKTEGSERAWEKFKDDLKMKFDRGWGTSSPNTLKISYQHSNPKIVAEVVNHVARFYVNENRSGRDDEVSKTKDFAEAQLGEAKRQMEEASARLNNMKMSFNGELPQQEQSLIAMQQAARQQLQSNAESINRAHQSRMLLTNSLDSARSNENTLKNQAEAAVRARQAAILAIGRAVSTGRPMAAQRALLSAKLYEDLVALRERYSDQHPEVRRKLAQYNDAKAEEATMAASTPKADPTVAEPAMPPPPPLAIQDRDFTPDLMQARERVQSLQAQITVGANEIVNLEKDRGRLSAEIDSLNSRMSKLPLREQQLASVQQDYSVAKANYEAFRMKALDAGSAKKVEDKQQGENFSLLDPARVPTEPIKPARKMLAIGAALLGLIMGAFAAIGVDLKRDVFLGEWELPPGTPVLGRVVYIPASHGDNLTRVTKWA